MTTIHPDGKSCSQQLPHRVNGKKFFTRERRTLSLASWNLRSLVEDQGDARICRSRHTSTRGVNRKLDLLAGELKRYGVAIAGVQETKWFGSDVWPAAANYTLLHSGHPLPGEDEVSKRNEGVGIMMNKFATAAWKEAGEKWDAVSSRIISARLKLVKRGQRQPGGSRETCDVFATIISAYAPTAKATTSIKSKFLLNFKTP